MEGSYSNIKIQGISAAIPTHEEENLTYAGIIGEKRAKRQIKTTGVKKRRLGGLHQRPSDLCYEAALPLLKKLDWNKDDIKVLIYITQGPDYSFPSTAFSLQKRLGLSKDCFVFDINLGCSSFNAGVHVASSLLQSCETHDKALLLLSDISSGALLPTPDIDVDTIANRMLFGAAGTAVAIEKVEKHSLFFMNKSDGSGYDAIIGRPGRPMTMNGGQVFEFAINDVSTDVKRFKQVFNIKEDDIDFYIFHQAQKLILDNIAAVCEIPAGKELRSLDTYGNTSGSSVPFTLCVNQDKFQEKEKINVLFSGYGVGLSWGCIFTEVDTENILPVLETDAHYEDDKLPSGIFRDTSFIVLHADTELGESISRSLSFASAEVIMVGQNMDKLNSIQDDLYEKSYVVSETNLADILDEFSQNNDISEIGGIVFTDGTQDMDMAKDILHTYSTDETEKSLVLLSPAEERNSLVAFMESLEEEIGPTNWRFNAITYQPDCIPARQIVGEGQDWVQEFIRNGCPEDMKSPLYLGYTVQFLLSDDSHMVSGSILQAKHSNQT